MLVVVFEGSARSTPQIDVYGPVRLPTKGRSKLERARGEKRGIGEQITERIEFQQDSIAASPLT